MEFDASPSTGSSLAYAWEFGDGSPNSFEKVTTHTYQDAGTYQVKLSLTQQGCFSPGCPSDSLTKSVTVGSGKPPFVATFETSAECFNEFGVSSCQAEVGQEVTFTGTTKGADQHQWDFGDGTEKTGKNVSHTWAGPGTYTMSYTASNAEESDTTTERLVISGDPIAKIRKVVVPWISHSANEAGLPQSSDLNVHNPGEDPLTVQITFRKRGLPEPDPPSVERTIPAGATLHVPDAMAGLFGREDISGFVFIETLEGSAEPIANSTNRTFQGDGRVFGQVVPGFPIEEEAAARAAGDKVHHLVGLNANGERLAYFGITNPNDRPLRYHLRFYDAQGNQVGGTTELQGIARFGQKQYQDGELLDKFGVGNLDDYRIEIVVPEGNPRPFVYGANLRLASLDPSFLQAGRTDATEVFLLGALNTPGLAGSFFQSDLVLGNTAKAAVACDVSYIPAGFNQGPTDAISRTLLAGESLRVPNVVSEWDVGTGVGVLRVSCEDAGGAFPVVQGESYDVSRPGELYGQFMPALTLEDAATPADAHMLVGLEQNGVDTRTTLWLYNPSGDEVATYSIRYFDLEGNDLGGESELRLGRGKLRQVNPSHHPFGEAGVPEGFVVKVEVSVGQLLTAAQVVNASNDPAYIRGE